MNENTPNEPTPEPTVEQPVAQEPEAPTQTLDPAAPSWALDRFKRNTVVGGAAVIGAIVALAGASLVDDNDHGKGAHAGFHGGPPAMTQGDGQFQQGGPGGPGMQEHPGYGQGRPDEQQNRQQGPSGKTGSN
jgi:hypothetical protein